MIYVCVVARNQAPTVGLLLWKLRKVLQEFPREYHILVADIGSDDGTDQTLETYQRALPMTLQREAGGGYAAGLDALVRDALARSDRPKRDCILTLPADFSISPAVVPELVKRFESGADLVVAEAEATASLGMSLVRRWAPWLLKPGLTLPGVRDLTSGVCLVRLITLKSALKDRSDGLLESEGLSAHAELLARAGASARQITTLSVPARPEAAADASLGSALALALDLFRTGRRLRIPAPTTTVQRT